MWRAKDAGWWRRERVVELGQEFGAAGPAALDWLESEAKAQNDGGRVRTGWRALAHSAFLKDAEEARTVVMFAVEIGALDDFEEAGRGFVVRVSGFHADQAKGKNALRMAANRADAQDDTDPHEPSPAHDCTGPHSGTQDSTHRSQPAPTGQERREEKRKEETTTSSNKEAGWLRVELDDPDWEPPYFHAFDEKPLDLPVDAAVFCLRRDLHQHPDTVLTGSRRRAISAALDEDYPSVMLAKAVAGALLDAHLQGENDRGRVYDDLDTILNFGKREGKRNTLEHCAELFDAGWDDRFDDPPQVMAWENAVGWRAWRAERFDVLGRQDGYVRREGGRLRGENPARWSRFVEVSGREMKAA